MAAFDSLLKQNRLNVLNSADFTELIKHASIANNRKAIELFTAFKGAGHHAKPMDYHYLFNVMDASEITRIFDYLKRQKRLTNDILDLILLRLTALGESVRLSNLYHQLLEMKFKFSANNYMLFILGLYSLISGFVDIGDKDLFDKVQDKLATLNRSREELLPLRCQMIAHHCFGNYRAVCRLYHKIVTLDSSCSGEAKIQAVYLNAHQNVSSTDNVKVKFLPVMGDDGYRSLVQILLRKNDRVGLNSCLMAVVEALEQNEKQNTNVQLYGPIESENSEYQSQTFEQLIHKQIREKIEGLYPSSSLTFKTLGEIFVAACQISSVQEIEKIFAQYKHFRHAQVSRQNSSIGLDYTPEFWSKLFISHRKNHNLIGRFRKWNSPLVPRKILTAMACIYAHSKDRAQLVKFMKAEVLKKDMLELYWSRYMASYLMRLKELGSNIQKQIDKKRNTESVGDLKNMMSWINKRKKKGLQSGTGHDGPFEKVYETISLAWRNSSIQGDSDNPLEIDQIIEELEHYESTLVNVPELWSRVLASNSD
jgi:hypothetical protein